MTQNILSQNKRFELMAPEYLETLISRIYAHINPHGVL